MRSSQAWRRCWTELSGSGPARCWRPATAAGTSPPTASPFGLTATLKTLLDEVARHGAGALLAASHRRRYVAAHGAARVIIGSHLGAPPAQLRWRRGPPGKPVRAGRFSTG